MLVKIKDGFIKKLEEIKKGIFASSKVKGANNPNGGGYTGNGGYPGNGGGYVGRCQIMRGGNAMGQRFFRVIDRLGRILFNTPDYNQAVRFAQQSPACY
jgi:hypothetical protein